MLLINARHVLHRVSLQMFSAFETSLNDSPKRNVRDVPLRMLRAPHETVDDQLELWWLQGKQRCTQKRMFTQIWITLCEGKCTDLGSTGW